MSNIAYYDKNFNDYSLIANDDYDLLILKGNNVCDIINSDIEKLVFKDCEKEISEFLDRYNEFFLFRDEVKLDDFKDRVYLLKLILKGYDENHDRLEFDMKSLNLKSPYRYSITDKSIDINVNVDNDFCSVKEFLYTIKYKFLNPCDKSVFLYINGDLIYDNQIKNIGSYIV
ncbi:DUF5416 family protein [Campylobacter pinnipediorum]|uniref:Uncharacterized protein n=1 Tax=Campylobacter pinnipediorum subsp. pinnipediorum TaxID=1660067 RepID=A0AAX0LAT2_9BACT|nr:DUF5416 family protein [Campylobacter pinnipediorum]AQW81764.1 hypothetical protein CPIN17260_1487 [Campylobacter pinnipediorum subsp. pinnipediorum]AQW83440.1 hypothetical protein CPIN17261_1448 [Campylobacter pinnipediorum subsp. pinnipediorum]AQW84961.1 hypothetical protein CPIN17262_1293 [Campylobacter pinnipediorum subsp. pinnipediorum]OPA79813.1 hypothetical protein BFG05_01560 [Campylobacter pinnipediorum subsp. pinnipediorum]OPA81582.1 hypothetical protein BFG04_00080 [Campylobacter